MTKKEHRLGVSEANLVNRHLKIETAPAESIRAAVAEIDEIYGMDSVAFDEKHYRLDLAYDASRLSIEDVEKVMTTHGLELSHGWWTQHKESNYRFVDQNVKDNAKHEPWSCHKK